MSNIAIEQRLQSLVEAAQERYVQKNKTSQALHQEAVQALPGGNTRTVLHVNPFPIYMKSGKGYQVTSEDDQTFTDFACEFTAALYGHSRPEIHAAITHVLQGTGMNIGATTKQECIFAQELCKRFALERVRFANSGTEANLHALAAAKLFTGKRKVVAFNGGYHGGVITFNEGRPAANTINLDDWIVADFNDLESAKRAIKSEGVAAVIMEGMQGAAGCFVGTEEFLRGVQTAASEAGVIFILDEVMTSRMSGGGLSQMYGLAPDLKTFGKWLGGGLAFGAFGGRADIMAAFDPRLSNSVSHSGTFNNNTLVTHAGYAGMTQVYTPEAADVFTEVGEKFRGSLNEATKGTRMCFTGIGTAMKVHFTKDGKRYILCGTAIEAIPQLLDLFWYEMTEQSFWITRRGFMSLIWETPSTELDKFVDAVSGFVSKYREYLEISS